ncbi:MAG: hypothetical protein IMF14_07475 [Proteobacteria bacterium]|nr:hypothetical protein [Pseudomonadota bacterium]
MSATAAQAQAAEPSVGEAQNTPGAEEAELAESTAINTPAEQTEADDEYEDEDEDEDEEGIGVIDEELDYAITRKHDTENPCERGGDAYNYDVNWYDESQVYINSRFCEPALWFDNFFANDRVFAEGAAGTYIRWRNEFTVDEEEGVKFKTKINLSVELPGVQDRLRLTIESDEDEDLRDIAPGSGQDTTNSLGLQLDFFDKTRSKFNVSVSLKPRIRFRYRYTYPATNTVTLRLTQEAQREKAINSARTQFDAEKLFDQRFLFRSTTEGKVSEEFDGVDWLQALVVYHRVNKKTSLSYESSANGITEPRTLATNYRVGVRYRKNFHRPWLFFEVAPEMTWPVTLGEDRLVTEDRRSKWLMFFRLEIHFGNAYKKRYQDYN